MKELSFLKRMYRGASLVLLLLVLLWSVTPAAAQSDGPNRAGLVVVHGDGGVTTRCVSFAEPEISGMTLLQRSGLLWQSSNGPMGSALCALDGEGCAASDCFCKCKQAPCAYWNYFTGNGDGSWTYSGVGVAVRTLKNGDIDGWVWGDGSTGPSFLTIDSICNTSISGGITVKETPTKPSPTPEPTATLTITPSPTSVPKVSPEPSLTASPTATPTYMPAPAVEQESTSTNTPDSTPTAMATAATTAIPESTPTPSALPISDDDSAGKRFGNTPVAQLGGFALLLSVLTTIYFLQRRRK